MANNSPNQNRDRGIKHEREASPLSIEGIRGGTLNHLGFKLVMFLLIAIFAVGFLFTSFNPNQGFDPEGNPLPGGGPSTIAKVGNERIERAQFEMIAARQDDFMAQFGQKVGPLEYFSSRRHTLQSLIDNAALVLAARESGIKVSRDEISAEINKQIDEQIKNQQEQGEAAFRRAIESQYGSLEAYREEMRKILEGERESLEKSLLVQKLEQKVKDENKVTEDDYKKAQTKLQIRQLLIRPSAAPADDEALEKKNKDEAKAKADKLAAELKKTPTAQAFAEAAKKESDDTATKEKGGDLGWKLPSELTVAPATRAAIVHSKEKIIGPITDEESGDISIFFVENRVLKLPEDYEKNKAELLKEFEEEQDNEAWNNAQAEIVKHAHPEILDPAYSAYIIQSEEVFAAPAKEQDALRQKALQKYEEALKYAAGMEATAVRYQMSQLYRDLKQPKKMAEVLKTAVEKSPDTPALGLEYARALREAGDEKAALEQLKTVSKALDEAPPAAPSMFGGDPNEAMRFQIASEYDALKKSDLADAERQKIAPADDDIIGGEMMPPMP